MKPNCVLEVENLSVSFGDLRVLDSVSFAVERGSALAIIGPNGAGKSVLLRAIIGSLVHTGSVRWAPGTRIGFVPQKLDLDRDLPLTGNDLIRAKAHVHRASIDEVARTIAMVGLGAAEMGRAIGAMSGGQFQRLLIAMALVGDPTVLLLDEPAAGVDAPGQAHLSELIDRLRADRAVTVVLISHDLSVVFSNATNVLCLGNRTAAAFGPPREVLTPSMLTELYGTQMGLHVHSHD
jgi:zinc transport system ATP-binding protein